VRLPFALSREVMESSETEDQVMVSELRAILRWRILLAISVIGFIPIPLFFLKILGNVPPLFIEIPYLLFFVYSGSELRPLAVQNAGGFTITDSMVRLLGNAQVADCF